MEQFLTGDIWNEVNKLVRKRQTKIACIAYVTSTNLQLTTGDTLVCNASTFAIKFGETSAKILDTYFKRGVKIYSNQNLHSKLLLTNSFLVIGSANLSTSSAERLTESSVVTNNDILLSQAKAFCFNLTEPEESKLLTRKDIDKLLKIKVVKRPFQPTTKSKIRNKKFGNCFWVLSIVDLKEKIELNEIAYEEEAKELLQNDDVTYIRMTSKSSFRSLAKEGDRFFKIWTSDDKKQRYLYPLNTILLVQKNPKWTKFYYDETKTENKRITWNKFLSLVDSLNLEKKIYKSSTKEMSSNDSKKLKSIFK